MSSAPSVVVDMSSTLVKALSVENAPRLSPKTYSSGRWSAGIPSSSTRRAVMSVSALLAARLWSTRKDSQLGR